MYAIVNIDIFTPMSNCESVKEAWNILQNTFEGTSQDHGQNILQYTFEGTSQVRGQRLKQLISKFDALKMEEHEII